MRKLMNLWNWLSRYFRCFLLVKIFECWKIHFHLYWTFSTSENCKILENWFSPLFLWQFDLWKLSKLETMIISTCDLQLVHQFESWKIDFINFFDLRTLLNHGKLIYKSLSWLLTWENFFVTFDLNFLKHFGQLIISWEINCLILCDLQPVKMIKIGQLIFLPWCCDLQRMKISFPTKETICTNNRN